MQVIYIDMLFLLNFVMDYIIFWMSAKVLGYRVNLLKVTVTSILAALLYCLMIVVPLVNQLPMLILQLLIPIVPILYLFKPNQLKVFGKIYIICTVVAGVVGGVTFNIYYVLGKARPVTPLLPIGVGIVLCILLFCGFQWIRKRCIAPYFEYEVRLNKGGDEVTLSGYLDTGNRLYTMTDHRPVMIGNYEAIRPILSEKQQHFLQVCKEKGIESGLGSVSTSPREKYYLIPFSSIGCKEGMLVGIPMECIGLKRGQWNQSFDGGVVGIHFGKLFNCDAYDILIHPDYMKIE